jgi:hypothetical protein
MLGFFQSFRVRFFVQIVVFQTVTVLRALSPSKHALTGFRTSLMAALVSVDITASV